MSLRSILVDVEREERTGDGSGGKVKTWTTIISQIATTQNFYGRTSQLLRLEQAAHGAQGPGVMTRKSQLFVFREQPFPDIRIQDRIVTPDGKKYVVQFDGVRKYDLTMQVDVELVG